MKRNLNKTHLNRKKKKKTTLRTPKVASKVEKNNSLFREPFSLMATRRNREHFKKIYISHLPAPKRRGGFLDNSNNEYYEFDPDKD